MAAILIPVEKHPDEVLRFAHDWSEALLFLGVDVGEVLRTELDVDTSKRPTVEVDSGDAVIDSFSVVGNTTEYWVSGGTAETRIKLSVWTDGGRKFVDEVVLRIKD